MELETKVFQRFVIKSKRDRYLSFAQSEKHRSSFVGHLAHFPYFKYENFEELKNNEFQVIKEKIKCLGKIKKCYLISELSEFDQKTFEIDDALNKIVGQGIGTIIVFGDAEIIYYEGEAPKNRWISKLWDNK